ncbi:MAG: divergent polysaccharide deacetylase family protein [Candidatus Tectomicrobia bacterium]|nr:divergent polysaccharide deacetylase family protein [Candidatus Tectomicrobia bacterium]
MPDAQPNAALREKAVEEGFTHAAAGGAASGPLARPSLSRSPAQLLRAAPAQPPPLPGAAPGLPADLSRNAAAPLRPEPQRWASAAGAGAPLNLYQPRAAALPVLPGDGGASPAAPPPPPRVAILIDDIGWDLATLRRFLALDADLSYAVLPQLEKSREAALTIAATGHEVLLHLPMEPHEYPDQDPGRGALLLAMEREELRANFLSSLQSVPMRVGVNNHMGSRFTENKERMSYVLSLVKAEGLFFVDSLTTPRSVALQEARQIGLRAMARHVFLDHEVGLEGTLAQVERLIRLAERHGSALGIGHPHPTTLQALQETLPTLRRRGVRIVPVSSLLD